MLDEPIRTETPMSVGDWVLTIFITSLPLVGLIMLFVWAFGDNAIKTKSNYAKAMLIWILIIIVLYVIIFAIFGSLIFGAMRSGGNMGNM